MKVISKIICASICLAVAIGCNSEKAKKEAVIKALNIEKEIAKDIKENITKAYVSSEELFIKDQTISVIDVDKDGLLDAVAFLKIFNSEDNSFVKTIVTYYKNVNEKLVFKHAIAPAYFISPADKGELIKGNVIYTKGIKPNDLGELNEASSLDSKVVISDENLFYRSGETESEEINEEEPVAINDSYKFTSAISGLIYRDKPDGKVLGKFPYGKELHIIEKTGIEKTITDAGNEITGEWVAVEFDKYSKNKVYVFDGFLKEENELDVRELTKRTPAVFEKSRTKGLIVPGTYKIYDEKLKHTSSITVDAISDVYVVEKTKYKRPEFKNQEYCNWANYVEVVLARERLILFGAKIISISKEEKITLEKGKEVYLVLGENYTVEASDKNGLTGCDDFSEVFIKMNNTYSHIYDKNISDMGKQVVKRFYHNEGVSEEITAIKEKDNTIELKVAQSFQEGTGSYTLKIFKGDQWYYQTTDVKRE
ncbi:hypothetical protein [uncultured Tenacibaculum sp.]|uniref:hypothetical protein n=1 Tax=uncultured Tenacibaculum sp. TaxID=174713 RepID=UPI0026194217|nr:hypothetical protein [uncultured Tenacibaculum sp.]